MKKRVFCQDRSLFMHRRDLLTLTAGLAAVGGSLATTSAMAQTSAKAPSSEPPRLALLLGNRDYPDGEDLPSIHKNVRDLRAALERRGFSCTESLDQDRVGARETIERFARVVRQAPAQSTVFFYFSGHGAQIDAENLLVGARQSPKAPAPQLDRGSLKLASDILALLPTRPQGLTIAVIDACRTSLKSAQTSDGLNQVEAPEGTLIAFATGAGRPAIAPAVETDNTFYTASLVKLMDSAAGEISFSDLFQLVKADVQHTMLNHPLALLRQFAQFPFTAENVRIRRQLAPSLPTDMAPGENTRFSDANEAQDFELLEAAVWPAEVLRLARVFLQRHPSSKLAGSAQVAQTGAAEAAKILRRNDVRLYRSAFRLEAMPNGQQADLFKAGRGDKDAAVRLGRYWRTQADFHDLPTLGRYEGWLQYAAALGNGIAAYELALFYRRMDQPQPASTFESRARELGYTPPPSLDNTRK